MASSIERAVQLVSWSAIDLQPLKSSHLGKVISTSGLPSGPSQVSCARASVTSVTLCNVPSQPTRPKVQVRRSLIGQIHPSVGETKCRTVAHRPHRSCRGSSDRRRALLSLRLGVDPHGTDDGRGAGARCLRGPVQGDTAWIPGPEPLTQKKESQWQGALRP